MLDVELVHATVEVSLWVLHQEVKKVEVQQANQRRQQEARQAEARRALQVVSTGVEKDNWGTYAVGKVVNRGSDTYRDLTVAIHVLDGAGSLLENDELTTKVVSCSWRLS